MADVSAPGRPSPPPSVPTPSPGTQRGLGKTDRTDPWWIEWFKVAGGLAFLGLYAFWAVFQPVFKETGTYYPAQAGGPLPYLSPFNSPEFLAWKNHPIFLPSGFIALVAIVVFRGTCYYYRKAYYRAFFADPAGCAVGESRHSYQGETRWFKFQNAHRYFFYLAGVALVFLWVDTVRAFIWNGHFGMGLGTLVMLVNVVLLSGYTFGCHSLRHLVGGGMNCMSCSQSRTKAWGIVSFFNGNHQQWAWASLISVCACDLYIRLVGLHVFADPRFF